MEVCVSLTATLQQRSKVTGSCCSMLVISEKNQEKKKTSLTSETSQHTCGYMTLISEPSVLTSEEFVSSLNADNETSVSGFKLLLADSEKRGKCEREKKKDVQRKMDKEGKEEKKGIRKEMKSRK